MSLDIVLLGIQMPALIPIFVIVAILNILIDRIMSDMGLYKYVWHLGLFRTAFFITLFAICSLIVYH